MKKICLLGGNGYIGSSLYNNLDYNLTSIDLCWFGKDLGHSKKIDAGSLTPSFLGQFDTILLFSGHSSVKMCEGPYDSVFKNNVKVFENIASNLLSYQTLIYASSGSVYGNKSFEAIEEGELQLPINHYDKSKQEIDKLCRIYISSGKKIIGLRLGTVNGWSPNLRTDLMINGMVIKSLTDIMVVSNLGIQRPILGINDLVRAIDYIIQDPKPGVYNLASFNTTVDEVSNNICNLLKVSRNIDQTPGVIYDFSMNTNKFQQTYQFTFKDSIDSIVTSLLDKTYQVSNRNQYINYV